MCPQVTQMDTVGLHRRMDIKLPFCSLDHKVKFVKTDQKKGAAEMVNGTTSLQPSRKDDEYYCEKDLIKTIETFSLLSHGCYYFPEMSSTESRWLLKACPVGTFIVRDSSDAKYLYTISVKTICGPTSIRIAYEHGRFALDSDEKSKHQIPQFTSVLDLIDYYVRLSAGKQSEQCRFLDRHGKKDLPIIMSKPKLNSVPSLKHLCRTSVVQHLPAKCAQEVQTSVDELKFLPKPIRSYIKDYPYLY